MGSKLDNIANSEACNPEIYQSGKVVFLLDGKKKLIEQIVQAASERGPVIDWHYVAGRAVVKTLGDIEQARISIKMAMPVIIG